MLKIVETVERVGARRVVVDSMELLIEAGIMKPELLESLMQETNELLAITVASITTARKGKRDAG